MKLSKKAAEAALHPLADQLGIDVVQLASGATTIVEFHMAELIRQVTVEQGYDPRDFVVFAFGGAGFTHAAGYAKELGAQAVVVPLGDVSSAWSAFGCASSDLVHIHEKVEVLSEPFDPGKVNSGFEELEETGRKQLLREGVPPDAIQMSRFADIRYKAQIHEVEIPVPAGPLSAEDLENLVERFEEKYEALYGKGAGFRGAGIELVTLRCEARGVKPRPTLPRARELTKEIVAAARLGSRSVFWFDYKGFADTPVYYGPALRPGNSLVGPAIVEMPNTTIVVHPGQVAGVDAFSNFVIELGK